VEASQEKKEHVVPSHAIRTARLQGLTGVVKPRFNSVGTCLFVRECVLCSRRVKNWKSGKHLT
jgi:hypothetical protein